MSNDIVLKRTRELVRHIKQVQKNAMILGEYFIENGDAKSGIELIKNSLKHDQSKFEGIEWEFLVLKRNECSAEELKKAIKHHNTLNSHHPEFWCYILDMPKVCLSEMVCDWLARSQEQATDVRHWINTVAMERYEFSAESEVGKNIFHYLDIMTAQPFRRINV